MPVVTVIHGQGTGWGHRLSCPGGGSAPGSWAALEVEAACVCVLALDPKVTGATLLSLQGGTQQVTPF